MSAKKHWTAKSSEDYLYKIAADFIRQLEQHMEQSSLNQSELAKKLGVTEGRVSQVINNPGNLTLKKVIEYARAVGLKVSVVAYNDDDPDNQRGPINAEIFSRCWQQAGKPNDVWALTESRPANTLIWPGAFVFNVPSTNLPHFEIPTLSGDMYETRITEGTACATFPMAMNN